MFKSQTWVTPWSLKSCLLSWVYDGILFFLWSTFSSVWKGNTIITNKCGGPDNKIVLVISFKQWKQFRCSVSVNGKWSDSGFPCYPVERGSRIQEQIVIGTPGTVLDWCLKFKFIDPKKIKVFVLDEADVMIATQGHQDQSIRIQRWVPVKQGICKNFTTSTTFFTTNTASSRGRCAISANFGLGVVATSKPWPPKKPL